MCIFYFTIDGGKDAAAYPGEISEDCHGGRPGNDDRG